MIMDEITEEPAALVERVAALDIGKATLTACVRVPHEDKPGARRQEVRTYATLTPALLELRDWLICQGVTLVVMEATDVIRGSKAKNWTLRRSCRGRGVRGGEAKSAATRGGSQMSATVGHLRRRRSCR